VTCDISVTCDYFSDILRGIVMSGIFRHVEGFVRNMLRHVRWSGT
jgi:hypothetical protein